MSSQHHHSPSEQAARDRLLDEFLHKEQPRFPAGKISENDQGELAFAIALDLSNKAVVIRFAKPVDFIGLDRVAALHLADLLIQKAAMLPKEPAR